MRKARTLLSSPAGSRVSDVFHHVPGLGLLIESNSERKLVSMDAAADPDVSVCERLAACRNGSKGAAVSRDPKKSNREVG